MSHVCFAVVLGKCFLLWEAQGKRLPVVRTSMRVIWSPVYWAELRQALKPAGTAMTRSLCSYSRNWFSAESKEVRIGATTDKNSCCCPSASWSWVAWGRHFSLPRQSAKLQCMRNLFFCFVVFFPRAQSSILKQWRWYVLEITSSQESKNWLKAGQWDEI